MILQAKDVDIYPKLYDKILNIKINLATKSWLPRNNIQILASQECDNLSTIFQSLESFIEFLSIYYLSGSR